MGFFRVLADFVVLGALDWQKSESGFVTAGSKREYPRAPKNVSSKDHSNNASLKRSSIRSPLAIAGMRDEAQVLGTSWFDSDTALVLS